MLEANGGWVPLGSADEQKPAAEGTVEALGRSPKNPVGGWYGLRKGYRGRVGMYMPPLLEALGLAEVEHNPKNNRMRALQLYASGTACIQRCTSGTAPRWMSTRASRSRMETAPGFPSPTSHEARADFTAPTGVMTAAVPQAKTSLRDPSAQPALHCSTLTRPSSASYPRSLARVSSESRVTPGSSVPVSSGVTSLAFGPRPKTKQRFMPPISSTQRCSMASSHTTWSQPCSAAWA